MKLNTLVKSMNGYISEPTIIDFLLMHRTFEDTRYTVMRRKARDIVTAVLIASAKNKELFNTVAKWGENHNIASTATFSRRKNFLKKLGIIEEENVIIRSSSSKIKTGRPLIRMSLNEKKLREYFGE